MADLSTKELLNVLKQNSDHKGNNIEGGSQVFECRSSWLNDITWSPMGEDGNGIMTITFIPSATNGKPPVNVYGVKKHYAHSFANATSPGQRYLNEIAGGRSIHKTSSFQKLTDLKSSLDSLKAQSEFYEKMAKKYFPSSITKHIDKVKSLPKQSYVALMRSGIGNQIKSKIGSIGHAGKSKFKNSVYAERHKLFGDIINNRNNILKAFKDGGPLGVVKELGKSSEYIKKYSAPIVKKAAKSGVAKALVKTTALANPITMSVAAVFSAVKFTGKVMDKNQDAREKRQYYQNIANKGFETDREKLLRQLNNPNSRINRNPEKAMKLREQLENPNSRINRQSTSEAQIKALKSRLNNPNSRLNRRKYAEQREEALARLDLLEKAGY